MDDFCPGKWKIFCYGFGKRRITADTLDRAYDPGGRITVICVSEIGIIIYTHTQRENQKVYVMITYPSSGKIHVTCLLNFKGEFCLPSVIYYYVFIYLNMTIILTNGVIISTHDKSRCNKSKKVLRISDRPLRLCQETYIIQL